MFGATTTEEFAGLPLDRLEEEIGELAAHISAATCRWLALIAEVDRREGYTEWGFACCSTWLSWRCSLGPAAARDHVRVARCLDELPRIRTEFASGALTYSKVRALTRVANGKNEEQLVILGRHATAAQLERFVRAYRGVIRNQVDAEAGQKRDSHLSCSWTDDGELEIRGRLPVAEGAIVVKALECARDHLRTQSRDEGAAPPANVDALALMAGTLLANGPCEGTTGDRYQVVVHVDADVLGEDRSDGRCEIEDAAAVEPETVRRLACDSSLVTMIERGGRPLSVGRRTRAVPSAMRRALRSRDGGCRFPGCSQRRFVDAHHIDHWAHGGETKLSNLVQLCRRHHRLLHEHGFSVERDGEDLRFRRPDGKVVVSVPRPPRGDHASLVRQNARRGLHPDADTCFPISAGDRLDYGMAVDGLLQAEGLWDPG
jgi:hypothetical protein